MSAHRQQVLAVFSGTLCVDELHLGQYTLLLATDPLTDLPVAFAVVRNNDKEHMRRFLKNLKDWGLNPKVVITDGSALYPDLLATLWPDAEHQLCVFHVLQDINDKILDAVKRQRRAQSRRGQCGRKRRRGRPTKAQQRRRQHQRQTERDKAKFVFRHRHLIVKRRDHLTEADKADLKTMLAYLPALGVLREFADALPRLFEVEQTEHQAWCRWHALRRQAQFQAVPELVQALELMEAKKFRKMIAFLRSPAAKRVRTNNHVERCNRKLRWWEKVRYKWRRRRTLVRFLVLAMDHWWKRVLPLATQRKVKRKSRSTARTRDEQRPQDLRKRKVA
jgi:hypothetical protein